MPKIVVTVNKEEKKELIVDAVVSVIGIIGIFVSYSLAKEALEIILTIL